MVRPIIFFPQTVSCWGSQCCLKCVRFGWDAVSASLVSSSSCLRSCLPTCLPSWLGCCVRLPGLVFLLSPVLSPNLSPILAGVLRPPSTSLVSSGACLPTCLPFWLVRCLRLPGLVFLLSPVLSPNLLVLSCSCFRSCLPGCLSVQLPDFVFLLFLVLSRNLSPVWDAVSASLVLSCSCLRSCLPACFLLSPSLSSVWRCSCLGCCVRLPSLVLLLSPNLSPNLAGVLRSLVCGIVSEQASGLGCCVRLLGFILLLSPVLSRNLSPVWGCCVRLPGLDSCLSHLFFLVS